MPTLTVQLSEESELHLRLLLEWETEADGGETVTADELLAALLRAEYDEQAAGRVQREQG